MAVKENKLDNEIKKLEEEIKSNILKNIYFFFGEEKYLKSYYKNMIIENVLGESEKEMNLEVITKETYNANTIKEKIDTAPFFSQKRIVILDEIGIFNKGELSECLLNVPNETIVIILEEKTKAQVDEANDKKEEKFQLSKIKENKEKVGIINFNEATDNILINKIKEIAQEEKKKIDASCMRYLIERIGTSLSDIENEMKKLCMFLLDRKDITKDDIDAVCSIKLEEKIFDMISDLTDKNAVSAMKKYKSMIASGEAPIGMLSLIIWQYTMIYECKIAMEENKAIFEIMDLLGAKEYPIKKAMSLASKMNKTKLIEIIKDCNETSKTILKDPTSIEILMYKIAI